MADQLQSDVNINRKRQDTGVQVISSYLTGGKVTPEEAAASKAYLDMLPDEQVAKIKMWSARANQTPPKINDGEAAQRFRADRFELRRMAAFDHLTTAITDANKANPVAGEKFIDVFVTRDPKLAIDIGPKDLAVQQQQAYLKVLGYDIGKTGLDGIAGKDSKTQKALDEFAKKMGIDPNDKERVNQTLFRAMLRAHQPEDLERMQKVIDAGKASPDDIKTLQWVLKGSTGAQMPMSLRGDKMDGIAGPETKTILKGLIEDMKNEPVVERVRLRDKFAPAVGTPAVPEIPVSPKKHLEPFEYVDFPDRLIRLKETDKDFVGAPKKVIPDYEDVLGKRNITGIDLGGDFGKAGQGNTASLPSADRSAAATFSEDVAMRKERSQSQLGSPFGGKP